MSDPVKANWTTAIEMEEALSSASELARQASTLMTQSMNDLDPAWKDKSKSAVMELMKQYAAAYSAVADGIDSIIQQSKETRFKWLRATSTGRGTPHAGEADVNWRLHQYEDYNTYNPNDSGGHSSVH